MILERVYDRKLAQASYLVGCGATGEAVVVDPNRDVEGYVAVARREGVRITQVTETHIHADYVSGARELARRTGAELLLSGEGGEDWSYGFAEEEGAILLEDGDEFLVGNIRFRTLHTPGHTPEHLTFVVTDTAGADGPLGAFTGDFLFVGDVGRPDLLEKAAGVADTMEEAARHLFRSLRRLEELPDWIQIWPGHGAGSACGKGMSALPHSTLGYERRFNWAFQTEGEEEFVREVLAGQPDPPRYFAEMKRINRDGPPVLGGLEPPPPLDPEALEDLRTDGALGVDLRPSTAFSDAHVPGTVSVPMNRGFTTHAGSVLPYHTELFLLVPGGDEGVAREAARDLTFIGLDRVAGFCSAEEAVERARTRGEVGSLPRIGVKEAVRRWEAGEADFLDVRGTSEWDAGHIPGAAHIPLGELPDRLEEVPRDRPLVVHCASGARSAVASSLLRARGFEEVANMVGLLSSWEEGERKLISEGEEAPVSG